MSSVSSANAQQGAHSGEHVGKRLGAFLCWAVVFADIGTSVYYVPGILYGQTGHLAGLFVALTLLVFLLLTLKYAEASIRFPEGGGEVTVATRGLTPWAGAVGGMFILIDYFLTAAISSLSGLQYFSGIFPGITPYVVLITVFVVAGLGVLNWWGIQESASVSAVIATIAFISDTLIVLLVFIHVPLSDIVAILREIFSGSRLTAVTLLSGYAGAFLAFSGLESIAQLSPVMKVPRSKTVTVALSLVAISVGFTGPLLTIFSTILLTDPRFSGTFSGVALHVPADPAQFVSELAGAYGGTVLAIATAVTASALLIFASNTAIIGGYHVVLALARMGYFPRAIRTTNAMRGTPHIAIAIVTAIPILVLIAVNGNIDVLGELYGFGLLGAFSLMCLSMDVIRWRERRGEPHIGAAIDPELVQANHNGVYPTPGPDSSATAVEVNPDPGPMSGPLAALAAYAGQVRASPAGVRVADITRVVAARTQPVRQAVGTRARAIWPDVKYYLGFLTTALVMVAWFTNLISKPLATVFGGGLTILGLTIAVLHYRYQAVRYPVVFLDRALRIPDARLVVLTADKRKSRAVIEAAMADAKAHPPTFLYLAPASPLPTPRIFEIQDRFSLDEEAQAILSRAKRRCIEENVQGRYLYGVGGAKQIFDIAAQVRPYEIMAEGDIAKSITRTRAAPSEGLLVLSPDYVRYRVVDDVRVAYYVLHKLYQASAKERVE